MVSEILNETFPSIAAYGMLKQEIIEISSIKSFQKETVLMQEGEFIRGIPLLIEGIIKVYSEDQQGNEILLYYIEKGESCVMSMTALMKNEKINVRGVVEEDAKLLFIPAEKALEVAKKHAQWNAFFYDLFSVKYDELLQVISSLTFSTTRDRLLTYLKKQSNLKNSHVIKKTHQKIAVDLGVSREIISRLLKKMENEGTVKLFHGNIQIINIE